MYSIDEVNDEILRITKFSNKNRVKLINWFNRQNDLVKIDIFKEQKNQFFKLKSTELRLEEILPLTAFYLAIDKFYNLENLNNQKNKSQNLTKLASISNFSIKKSRKIRIKEKREKLINIWSVVQKLKEEDFSLREISKHLKSKHRMDVSHTYIDEIWKELEDDI